MHAVIGADLVLEKKLGPAAHAVERQFVCGVPVGVAYSTHAQYESVACVLALPEYHLSPLQTVDVGMNVGCSSIYGFVTPPIAIFNMLLCAAAPLTQPAGWGSATACAGDSPAFGSAACSMDVSTPTTIATAAIAPRQTEGASQD